MVRENSKKVMRYQKADGGEAAIVYDQKTGANVTVSGQVKDALESRAFQEAVANGGLPVPTVEVPVVESRPRRGRREGADEAETRVDADSMSPAELLGEWETIFAAGALKLIGEE